MSHTTPSRVTGRVISKSDRATMLAVFGIALIAIVVGLFPKSSTAAQQPPNIVLIVSDDQGYRDLGCFGGDEIKTPSLDRIARDGVRCSWFYVTWPACTPSRGSILTGRYPQRNGLYDMIRNDLVNYKHQFTEASTCCRC